MKGVNSGHNANASLKHLKRKTNRNARSQLLCLFVGNRSDCPFVVVVVVNLCSRLKRPLSNDKKKENR